MDRTRDIHRLLRFLGRTPGRILTDPSAKGLAIEDGTGRRQVFAEQAVSKALASGLVTRSGEIICATEAARSFLRRQMADREESFLDQHRLRGERTVIEDGKPVKLAANLDESPLAQLARLKDRAGAPWFSEAALSAGQRLARDFQFAGLQPRLTMSYQPRLGDRGPASGPGEGVTLTDAVLAARKRLAAAIAAMGPDLSGVALDVCCFEKGLEAIERERQWPARSAKLMLKTALQHLCRHYDPEVRAPQPRAHAWGVDGFRPEL